MTFRCNMREKNAHTFAFSTYTGEITTLFDDENNKAQSTVEHKDLTQKEMGHTCKGVRQSESK